MKKFELPVSDCNRFIGGLLTEDTIADLNIDGKLPKHGIIIWYEDKETAKAAVRAVAEAHWL